MKVIEVNHPLIQHKLGKLRSASISTKDFRQLTNEISMLLTYEATKDFEMEDETIQGWAGPVVVKRVKGKKITLVPILRAGIGMLHGVLDLIPSAKVSVVGFARDETTCEAIPYYEKLAKDMQDRTALILDPMLATGGTLIATIDMIKKSGCTKIKALSLVAAPEGIKAVESKHPDIEVFVAAVDQKLNEQAYIIPGLGDAGDKLFGTIY